MKRWPLFAIAPLVIACGAGARTVTTTTARSPSAQASAERPLVTREASAWVTCPDAAIRIEAGAARGAMCAEESARGKLTVIDLQDGWTPSLFAPSDGLVPGYRATYLALAREHDAAGKPLEDADALGELYGIVPSLAVVRERLPDVARHACHAEIDSSPIATLTKPFGQDHGQLVMAGIRARKALATQLERERVKRALPDFAALADVAPKRALYLRWKRLADQHAGIIAAQRHLVCEGFLEAKYADGTVTWRTGNALELFQRRNFLMPNERLDAETRVALAIDSRELDFRLALRILRERVVDASGLVEDGTAGDGPLPILGRLLDPAAMRATRGHGKPLAHAAPDLIGAATEAAARALGWLGPDELAAFLAKFPVGPRVALALPALPGYHAAHMDLAAEIDRGDVYYDARPIPRTVARRPNLVLYVDDQGTRRPLVRWPTTIGGWADARTKAGSLVRKWKESDVGPRLWKELFASPTWMPPASTPDRELVRNLWNGKFELKRSIMGPGPKAAFGMVLFKHHQPVKLKNGTIRYDDNGIGTHGSASVTSIVNGTSHGCHRMYNQLAVRLADFVLRHRDHVVKGQQKESYRRIVRHKGTYVAKVDTRGFLYELTPPVPVKVLPGTIKTPRKIPPRNAAPASSQ
ncbi:MAG: L,D-transpeptidase family protein [Kofleriaceae bacterium]